VVVLLAVLDLVTQAYTLAVVELVVPGVAAGIVYMVLNCEQYRGVGAASSDGTRRLIAAAVAIAAGAVLVITLALVGSNWYVNTASSLLIGFHRAALVTVLHYRTPYALAIAVVLVATTVAAALVIGRRSADEQTLDEHLRAKREREERARRRREDREQGRRRTVKEDT
jgi:hypothetical protein